MNTYFGCISSIHLLWGEGVKERPLIAGYFLAS